MEGTQKQLREIARLLEHSNIPAATGRTMLIRSIDRLNSGDTYADFEVDLSSHSITDPSADITIRYVSLPFTVYNVNDFTNTLTIEEATDSGFTTGATEYELTLTNSSYTGSQLASHLETQINAEAVANTYAVAYDSQTAKFTITATGDTKYFRFVFLDKTAAPSRLLGFTIKTNTTGGQGGGATLVSDNFAQLQPADSIQIRVEGFFDSSSSEVVGRPSDILLSVQCLVPFGHILNYTPADSNEAYHVRQLFGRKKIRLTFDPRNGDGSKTLPLNSDWEMFCAVRRHRAPHAERVGAQYDNLAQFPRSG